MTRRFLGLTTLSTLFAVGLAGCPSDDAPADTDTDSASSTSAPTSTGPSTSSTTSDESGSTSTTTSTTSTTTSSTTDPTSTGSESGSDSSSGTDTDTGVLPCPYTPFEDAMSVVFEEVATGFNGPVLVVGHPVDTDDLYVVQQPGQIKVLAAGQNTAPAENWLDIQVSGGDEQGLLGFAFHPDYANDSRIFVAYSSPSEAGATAVAEFQVEAGVVNVGSRREVYAAGEPASNHNGGMIQFGPDGMLYLSLGDGGPQNDACNHGQDRDTPLGTIIRIDPNGDGTPDQSTPGCPSGNGGGCGCAGVTGLDFTIPADNPFVGEAGLEEIYAYGFRNPWRFSFDPVDDTLWVADVGQNGWEEVSVIQAGDNAGWGSMEGFHCNNLGGCDDAAAAGSVNSDGFRMPVAEYENTAPAGACSVIGLGNYRSCESPAFDGLYFYGDLCTREVRAVSYDGATVTEQGVVGNLGTAILGGGYNAYGDVFAAGGNGTIFRMAPGA